ncbi:metal-dependent hydrolase [Alicyclobacillus acidoterrestris]|uniref:MYG1 family protein n=1 Tax=Alicyclobacillus suci TaxID=2816080 RepID=UPI001191D10E|nr:MYG1 family protein [Alicyclobacillus suci]GEO24797.1 metal-dependent hydrolase [Alicyclobacillus acidoterrestris]
MVIGTHHGKFHADEVFAVAILKQFYPDAKVIRSRDEQILSHCDIVVDVGRGKYDHHSTDKVYRDNGIPYASAGLIWRDFGHECVGRLNTSADADKVVQIIDERLIQAIDAIDNGVDLARDARIKGISELIASFNPPWNSDLDEDEAFHEAVQFATSILNNTLRAEIGRIAAIDIVKEAFTKRDRKEILELASFCPWSETLFDLDQDQSVLYVVFPDRHGQYRIQVVPKVLGSFEARKPLPASWAGKEETELNQLIGVDDAVFCHPARFIAGARSRSTILKMADLAIQSE